MFAAAVASLGFLGGSSLDPSFEMTGKGLSYALYGRSVVSQGRLQGRSRFDTRDLPEGSSVAAAFLYWSGERESHKAADTEVELTTPAGKKVLVHAGKVRTAVVSGLVYASKADVTRHLRERGVYEISSIEADPLDEKGRYTLGGWGLVVVFKDPAVKTTAGIRIHDGLLYLPAGAAFSLELEEPDLPRAAAVDLAVLCGFGRPWDGGSLSLDGRPVSGREDFAGGSGLSWDVTRDVIPLRRGSKRHLLQFLPDYNPLLPLAVVARFGHFQEDEIRQVAAFYLERAALIDSLDFFDLRDTASQEREFLAKEYLQEALRDKAVALFKTARKLAPGGSGELHLALGRLYLEAGKPDLAQMELNEAARSGKQAALAHSRLGRLFYEKGDLGSAIAHLTKARELSGGDSLISQNLGICFLQQGSWDAAAEHFEEALRLAPRNLTALRGLAEICEKRGQAAKRAALLEKIAEIERGAGE